MSDRSTMRRHGRPLASDATTTSPPTRSTRSTRARRAALEQHLAGCETCTERLRWLPPAVDVLPASVRAAGAAAGAASADLMDVVEREAALIERRADRAGRGPPRRRFAASASCSATGRAAPGARRLRRLPAARRRRSPATSSARRRRSAPSSRPTFAATADLADDRRHRHLEVDGDEGIAARREPATDPRATRSTRRGSRTRRRRRLDPPSSVFVVADAGAGDVSIPDGLAGADRVMVTREPEGRQREAEREPAAQRRARLRPRPPPSGRPERPSTTAPAVPDAVLPPPRPRDRRLLLALRAPDLPRLHDPDFGRHALPRVRAATRPRCGGRVAAALTSGRLRATLRR